jgi:hypothetical protein
MRKTRRRKHHDRHTGIIHLPFIHVYDVIWSLQCLRSADDGKPHGLPSVEEVKAEILEEMEMKKKTDLEWAADLIQMTVLRRSDMNNLVNKKWRREHGLRC